MDAPLARPIPTPTPPPPKKTPSILIGILLLFLGILVGLTLAKTTFLSNIRIPNLTATPTPIPSPAVVPGEAGTQEGTANWKTYTNEKYSFSYKYPQDFAARETSPNSLGASFAPSSYKDLDFQNLPVISFYVYTDFAKGTTHQEFIKALGGRGYSGIQNITTKNINEIQITQFSSRDLQAGSGGLDINTIITLKNGTLMISLSNSEKGMANTYDQILSTFRFLGQK